MVAIEGRLQREGKVIHIVTDRLEDLTPLLAEVGAMHFPHRPGPADAAKNGGRDPRVPCLAGRARRRAQDQVAQFPLSFAWPRLNGREPFEESDMRIPFIAAILILAAPAAAQQPRLGQRTTSPEAMVAQMNQASPEEEMRALAAAADAHPLGTLENPIRVGGPQGERAYLARLRCADGAAPRIGARREAGCRRVRLGRRRL